tara:strand:- start:28 stop:159 length:132 start_codon:yes stop_codon:yes gene_type:complete
LISFLNLFELAEAKSANKSLIKQAFKFKNVWMMYKLINEDSQQ